MDIRIGVYLQGRVLTVFSSDFGRGVGDMTYMFVAIGL
jgi:hypothetical protein